MPKTYTWSSDYHKHIRTPTGERPYGCPDRGKAFALSSDLCKHQRNMHHNKTLTCPDYGCTFHKPLSLLRHQRGHLGTVPFPCPDWPLHRGQPDVEASVGPCSRATLCLPPLCPRPPSSSTSSSMAAPSQTQQLLCTDRHISQHGAE